LRTARMSVQTPSPTAHPNCFSAILFHLVAAWTTWHSRRLSRPRPHGNSMGVLAVAIEVVVDAALLRHDERHLDVDEVEFLAEVVFDVALEMEERGVCLGSSRER